MPLNGKSSSSTTTLVLAAIGSTLATLALGYQVHKKRQKRRKRQERTQKILEEIQKIAQTEIQDLPSIISHFSDFQIDYNASIEDANKRRTTKYYELARNAHQYDLVPGHNSYPRLRLLREQELKRMYRYRNRNMSHRTILVMCDSVTSGLLVQARNDILAPLNYSHDIATSRVWIPQDSVLPQEDLHVTVSIPWWWHGIRDNNLQLSQELVARFRQALVLEFHHAFQIELERIVLLGGKTLVALWRCVGERSTPNDYIIFDRHGERQDPMVKLRRDIVECFTSEGNKFGQEPLTYSHRHYDETNKRSSISTPSNKQQKFQQQQQQQQQNGSSKTATKEEQPPSQQQQQQRPKLERQNTIEWKTPGLGDHDGFIHTTLARLPIECLSMTDVELDPIHRLCREATATYCGHRMVVSQYRFVETTGEGGESNPCVAPIFDETVQAQPRVLEVGITGEIQQTVDLHTAKMMDRHATIGNLPPRHRPKGSMDGLFDVPTIISSNINNKTKRGVESSRIPNPEIMRRRRSHSMPDEGISSMESMSVIDNATMNAEAPHPLMKT